MSAGSSTTILDFIGGKEVVVTVRRIKLRSNHHHQHTSIQLFTSRMPILLSSNSVKALKRKVLHFMDLFTPSSPVGLVQLCLNR